MGKIQEFNTEQTIAESNRLIRNMFNSTFTKRQMDLIYAVISLVKPKDDRFTEYCISYKAIGEIFNPANPDCPVTINDIEKAVKGIMNKSFQMEDDDEIVYYHYVETARLNKKEKSLKFKLNNEVQQFYLQLQKGEFTSFLLKDILALSTTFQMNLFKYLACNAGFKNEITIKIEDAKKHFCNKNITNGELTRRLDLALEAINAKTSINASYEKIKTGRTITGLKFTIENKYIKAKKSLTPAQIEANKEKSKEMWQENQEMKRRIAELEARLAEKEVV